MNKVAALKIAKRNFEDKICISHISPSSGLNWWLCDLNSFNTIRCHLIDVTLYSDASLQRWGDRSIGWRWLPLECQHHIIHLELLAAFFSSVFLFLP